MSSMASSHRGGSGASEKKKMVSKCSSSSSFSRRKVCGCGERTVLFTSNTPINPGRTFWRCPNWKKKGSCDFFEWTDEEVLQQAGNVEDCGCNAQEVAEMKKKIAKLQRKINEERKMKKFLIGALVLSWGMTIGFCVFVCTQCIALKQGM
ncbi:Zinc finger, GRF-type [Sesbania bispinosa]|nr:Zinc finger, GRF-type [Sesbania bispinosa]